MGTPLAAILTNTVSHDDDDEEEGQVYEQQKSQAPHVTTPQHKQSDNDSIPSLPSAPSPYSPPSQSLMSGTEDWMMRRRPRATSTSQRTNSNKPPALIHTASSSWHEDDEEDEHISLQQQQQQLAQIRAECQTLSRENNDLKHQLQKQTHTLLQRSRDHEQRQKALQQKWQSALLQLDKAKAMNHELKTNFQKQLQQAEAQANDWQEQCLKLQEQQPRRGKHVKEPIDAACQTDVLPENIIKQSSIACQTKSLGNAGRSVACQTDDVQQPKLFPTEETATQTDPMNFSSTLEERLGRIRDAAERAALVQEHQAALQQMQARHDAELERLEKQHEAALAQMVQQAKQHVQEQVTEHQQKIEQQHVTKLAALETQHQAELFRVRIH